MILSQRQIPRNPPSPKLNEEIIRLLTQLCFRQDNIITEPVDLIFLFSTHTIVEKTANSISRLLDKDISKKVFITGGFPNYSDVKRNTTPESELILSNINRSKFPDVIFYKEEKSRNTLENVTEALKVLNFSNYKRVLFIFKSHAAGRGYLTLRKYLPNSLLIQQTNSAEYRDLKVPISRSNWFTSKFAQERVFGEFLRIKEYGKRGDIEFDEVRDLVNRIDKSINQF